MIARDLKKIVVALANKTPAIVKAIEIKSSKNISPSFFKGLINYSRLATINKKECFLIYAGDNELMTSNGALVNWKNISKI